MSDDRIQERYVDLLRQSGDAETFQTGDAIFREGDLADRMYVIDSGSVSLRVGDHVRRDRGTIRPLR